MHNNVLLIMCGLLLLCFSGCSKESAPENEMPTLTTGEATAIGRKTATISGSISVPEGSEVKNCGFLYSTVTSLPEAESTTISVTLKGGASTYETTLEGLTPNTKYYYCLYANSGYTTTRSSVREFTTAADGTPALEATASISATETSLTVASKLSDDGGSDIQKFGFAYKVSGSADAEKMIEADRKENDGRYTFTITGLTAETSYEVRAFATNSKGTGYGEAVTLVTSAPELPVVQMETKEPGSTSIQISAKITNESDLSTSITEVGFCWSKDNETPTITDTKIIAELSNKNFSALLSGLSPETKYYIRAYAINKKTKTGYSSVISFTTGKSSVPVLSATTSITVEETTATVQSGILDNGGHDVTKFGFAYKPVGDAAETQKEVPASALQTDGTFRFTLTGLSSEKTYEIRAFAINSVGTGYGTSCSITTLALKSPQVTVEVGTVGGEFVSVTGVVQSAGGESSTVQEVGFCWSSSNAKPTLVDNKLKSTLDGVAFGSTISGLKAETKYYIRAYAVNEAKVGYSDVIEMTTAVSDKPDVDDNESPDKN